LPRTYKVLIDGTLFGKKGESTSELHGYNFPALVAAGVLEREPLAPVTCPACKEQGKPKTPPKFEAQDELDDHYADKHPALAVPDVEEVAA
jgi:hypothetical protein